MRVLDGLLDDDELLGIVYEAQSRSARREPNAWTASNAGRGDAADADSETVRN
jgi:hypothetical protein